MIIRSLRQARSRLSSPENVRAAAADVIIPVETFEMFLVAGLPEKQQLLMQRVTVTETLEMFILQGQQIYFHYYKFYSQEPGAYIYMCSDF